MDEKETEIVPGMLLKAMDNKIVVIQLDNKLVTYLNSKKEMKTIALGILQAHVDAGFVKVLYGPKQR